MSPGNTALVAIFLILSCKGPRQVIDSEKVHAYECQKIIAVQQHEILPIEVLHQDTFLLSNYSIEDLQIANAFGLIPDLRKYEVMKVQVEDDSSTVATLDQYIIVSNRLGEGLALAELELQSVADLIDCTIIKLKKYKTKVNEATLETQNRLSNWAILTGAATTVLTAGILLSSDDDLKGGEFFDWLAVAGGLVTGYLAVKSARVDKKIWLNPQKNFIQTIWSGINDQEIFPSSTWHLINQEYEIEGKNQSLRTYIMQEWSIIQNSLDENEVIIIEGWLLESEALYSESMIDSRIEMLETIGVGIDQLNRALYILRTKLY